MNRKEFPRTEQLEARKLLTGVEFVPTAKLITNSYEVSVDVADFDADGDLDVVFAERGSGAIRWQQNLDEGSFADSQTVAWATDPQDIVATDLDEDGQSDLAVLADNRLSLFQANSDSGWVRRAEYSSQQSISNLQFGSINGQTQNIVLQTGDASITVLTQRENRFDFVPLQSIPFAEKVETYSLQVQPNGTTDLLVGFGETGTVVRYVADGDVFATTGRMVATNISDLHHFQLVDDDLDGQAELVIGNTSGIERWEWNTAENQFQFAGDLGVGAMESGRKSFELLDMDADGDTDLLVYADQTRLFENTADGPGVPNYEAGEAVNRFYLDNVIDSVTADVNGDGRLDLIESAADLTRETPTGLISILQNEARIVARRQAISEGAYIGAADINGDGTVDPVVRDNGLAWIPNQGNGEFGAAQDITSDDRWGFVQLDDFDGDGDVDVVYSSYHGAFIQWSENTGQGQFAPVETLSESGRVDSFQMHDLDADGDQDIVAVVRLTSTPFMFSPVWYENTGSGLADPIRIGPDEFTPGAIAAGDLDQDGDADVVMATSDGPVLYRNSGDLTAFDAPLDLDASGLRPRGAEDQLQIIDFDRDGHMDVIGAKIYRNTDSTGVFEAVGSIAEGTNAPEPLLFSWNKVVDWDDDGRNDLMTNGQILLQREDFVFESITLRMPRQEIPWTLLDVDSDGRLDLLGQGASVPFNGGVRRATEWFQLEETYGDFQLASQHRPINRTQVAFQLFDANADGRNDLLAYLDRDIMVWENAGSGLAEPKLLGSLDAVVASLQSIDVDGDGHTDIVVQTGQQANQWLRNEGDFQFTAVASPLPAAVTFADWDGDGDADAIQQSDLPNIEFSVRLNTGNAQFDEATALFSVGPDAFDVMTVNLDDDSADELLITTESGVSWYRLDSDGSIGSQHIVGQPAVWLRDINGDGRDEVLVDAADGLIAYAFDPDTNSLVAPQTALGIGIYQDFNADGLIDYVGSEFSSPRQNAIRYGLPDGGFGDVQAAEHILLAEEFSGDNRTDAIGKIGDSFYYLLNQEATLEFIRRESIEWLVDMESLALLDVDGDQDLDIVVAADEMLYWFENIEPGRYANDARRLVDHFENYFDHLPIITTHDFDSDGDQDLLLVADEEGGVSWVENKGAGLFVEHVVARTSENENGFAVATGDINQDGAIDLLAADFAGNTLRWYENSDADPANRFLPSEPIAVSLLPSQVDLLDVDGDQDLDIVFIESLALHVLRNDGAGSFGAEETYATGESFYRYVADDLGNDGLVEVIWSDAGRIRAVQFTGSELREIDLQLPTDDVAWMEKDDVDGDGLNELVIGTFTGVEIWSWQNGRFEPSPWELAAFDYGIDYAFGDVNQDQRIEVVQLDWNDIGVYRQTANGAFELQQHVGLGWSEISNTAVGDIDGNGTSDLVVASGGGLHWRANQVWGIPTEPIEIAARSSGYAPIVADVDGDGDGDVLAHDGQQLVWHANGQNGQTWTSHVVGSAFDDWQTGDLNGDGNLDVVVMTESQLAWYRNLGQGQFAELETLRSVGENRLFHVADLDHDGSSDVVLVRFEPNVGMQVEWIRSVNGSLEEPQVMAKLPSRAMPDTIDWTQDGLLDLILFHDGTISLFENLGDGQFSEMQTLASNWAFDDDLRRMHQFLDMDADGDVDLVAVDGPRSTSSVDSLEIRWFENTGANQPLGVGHLVASAGGPYFEYNSVIIDLSLDGVPDVFQYAYGNAVWLEGVATDLRADLNRDGMVDAQDLAAMQMAILEQSNDLRFDLTLDNQVDKSDGLVLAESILNLSLGDANLDGVFDSADLVQIFQAGKYETDLDAVWAEGDWDFDGRFDSADLVAVFQRGNYVAVRGTNDSN